MAITPAWKSEASLECRQSGNPTIDPATDLSGLEVISLRDDPSLEATM